MGRDNYTWARVDCAVLHDPRIMGLPATGFRLYFTCYLLAFEYRSEVLPAFCDTRGISNLARLDARTAAKMLQGCCAVGLLAMTPDNRIVVVDASRNGDPRMKWDRAAGGTSSGETPDVSDTDRQREQTDREKRTEREPTGGAASLRVPKAHASPPSPKETPAPVQDLVAGVARNMRAEREPEQPAPERDPTEAELDGARKRLSRFGIGDLVRHLATGSPKGTLTDTLNDALRVIPEAELRKVCVAVTAKTDANRWPLPKTAAVLTARCKERMGPTA